LFNSDVHATFEGEKLKENKTKELIHNIYAVESSTHFFFLIQAHFSSLLSCSIACLACSSGFSRLSPLVKRCADWRNTISSIAAQTERKFLIYTEGFKLSIVKFMYCAIRIAIHQRFADDLWDF
jgi:hypothetical protein